MSDKTRIRETSCGIVKPEFETDRYLKAMDARIVDIRHGYSAYMTDLGTQQSSSAALTAAVANVAKGWKRNPSGTVVGTDSTNVSAALWRHGDENVQEVVANPNAGVHSMGVAASSFRKQTFIDGRRTFDGFVRPGSCNLIRAGERPRGILTGPWSMLHVYLPDRMLQQILDYEEYPGGAGSLELLNPGWAHDSVFARIGKEIQFEMVETLPFLRLRLDALGNEFAIHLLRKYSNFANAKLPNRPKRGGLAPWQVKRACEAIESRLDGAVSLEELASLVGLSPTHFSRAFKQSTGQSPFEWLLLRRMERAKQILARSSVAISEVAQLVGFSAQPQFTTAFKRMTGSTPAKWRKNAS